ncbi:MAG: phosphotransferase [Clostridia bacterium]|nr:phosphotransferase [Clostridia bacterium]
MNSKTNQSIINAEKMKLIIEQNFKDIAVTQIDEIGRGYDSVAYLVNNEYIFKIKISANQKKGYEKEKAILDFLNKNLNTNINIPKIEFYHVTKKLSIMGYKKIDGKFMNPTLYKEMTKAEQNQLKKDIAKFLKQMHSLDVSEISKYKIDNKQNVLDEYELLRNTIYDELNGVEKSYIERFMERLKITDVFNDRKCLCHNDFSANHLLVDNNKLIGIIDFGDSGIIDEYCDFIYLLENSEEEMGLELGEEVLSLYGDIDIDKAKEYQDIIEEYYPIETIVYGIKNERQDFIKKGRAEIMKRGVI